MIRLFGGFYASLSIVYNGLFVVKLIFHGGFSCSCFWVYFSNTLVCLLIVYEDCQAYFDSLFKLIRLIYCL